MFNPAPVILFVYNRPWHTEQTLEALMANDLANQSTLYIYCDGPKENANEEILQNIKKIREIIRKKQWCKKINIIEREKNLGLANSVIEGITKVVNEYGKIIVLEDDIITARGFLKYMNDALDIYKEEEQVFGIAGHTFLETYDLPSTYFLPFGTSWGWATWSSRWKYFQKDASVLVKQIEARKAKFNFGNFTYFQMLQKQEKKEIDSWAIRFYASMFLRDGLFLFPNISLLENIGTDELSTHTKVRNPFFPILKDKNATLKIKMKNVSLVENEVSLLRAFFEKKTKKANVPIVKKLKSKIARIFQKYS